MLEIVNITQLQNIPIVLKIKLKNGDLVTYKN